MLRSRDAGKYTSVSKSRGGKGPTLTIPWRCALGVVFLALLLFHIKGGGQAPGTPFSESRVAKRRFNLSIIFVGFGLQ